MSTKVDQTSAVGPQVVSMSATTTPSTTSTTGPKVSRFAAKTGFVIPKNKLSGSLVPIFRGGKKPSGNDTASEDNADQIPRKTRWGADLMEDAAVRRGRALAYQTRVDQITKLMKLGKLNVGDIEDSPSVAQNKVKSLSDTQPETEKSEVLEIERREAIGEILKLNPSYKAPADYKPLLKEATVPIPVKEYPGCNFAGLIFGPGSDTKKRLEKETGAKVQVYGIKANDGEKIQISSPDDNETLDTFEELCVHLSADTFEKVDGAVALIELLISSISGNLVTSSVPTVAGNDVKVLSQTMDKAVSCLADVALNQPVPQLTLASPHGQFQYHAVNFSAPSLNSTVPAQSSPSSLPSLFGPRPAPAAGYNSIVQNSSFVSSSSPLPRQVLSQPYMPQMQPLGHTGPPRNFLVSNPNPPPSQPSVLSSIPFTGSQLQAPGPLSGTTASMPLFPQNASSVSLRPLQEQPKVPAGSSTGWSQVPHPVVPSPVGASSSSAPPNMSATSTTGQYVPQVTSVRGNHPPSFAPGPPLGSSPALSAASHPTAVSLPMLVPAPMQSSSHVMSMMANFASVNQPAAIAPRPQRSSSGDFTFQPHQTHGTAFPMVPRPGSQAANPHALAPRSSAQLQAPQAPSFQFGVPSSAPQPIMQVFPRPQSGNQMGLPPTHLSSPRPPAFPSNGPVANTAPVSQMGLRNFAQYPQKPNMAGSFPPRPGHSLQVQQHYPALPNGPGNLTSLNPRFGSGLFRPSIRLTPGHSTGQQVYDPFSPTSVPGAFQHQGDGKEKARKLESDPEYEDLMASVGVKQ